MKDAKQSEEPHTAPAAKTVECVCFKLSSRSQADAEIDVKLRVDATIEW